MRISQKALPWIRTAVLLTFVAASLIFYGYFYILAGGRLPLVATEPYQVVFQSPANKNLVDLGQVSLNGVVVGRVQKIEVVNGLAQVTAGISAKPQYAPLHEGATATIKLKTLINETYIDIRDGNGPPIPTNTVLPPGNVAPPVDLDDVVRALPPQDRESLAGALQSLEAVTRDNQSGISQTIGSLGEPTNYVPAALKALSDQELALRQLSTNTARVLAALDTRQGQIVELVDNAELVTQATAGSKDDLANTIRALTPTLRIAQDVSPDLSRLAFALKPVADNLNRAAPPLNAALAELPATSKDLRELLPFLNSTLDKLPPTLERVPRFARDVQDLVPATDGLLDQANPVLAYIKPCAANIVTFFRNFGDSLVGQTPGGPAVRVNPLLGADSVQLPMLPVPIPPALLPAASPFKYIVGNNPPESTPVAPGTTLNGDPNSNIQCKTPVAPYTK